MILIHYHRRGDTGKEHVVLAGFSQLDTAETILGAFIFIASSNRPVGIANCTANHFRQKLMTEADGQGGDIVVDSLVQQATDMGEPPTAITTI